MIITNFFIHIGDISLFHRKIGKYFTELSPNELFSRVA